jgi:hypothetical protein
MNATALAFIMEAPTIDFGKPFIPEEFTPLSYTQSYGELTEKQRLRYNQLQALYFNEQIIFFEQAIGRKVLQALLRHSLPQGLEHGLREFAEEERQHTEMFRRLNQRCAPELYAASDFYFIEPPHAWMAVLNRAAQYPRFFTMFLWLMLLQEERSLYFSKKFIVQRGALEPHFIETHRLHLADEVGHVCWDEEIIEAVWRPANPFLRKMNARLFAWMLGEFFNAPKRAQLRVVHQLACEFQPLRDKEEEMRRQMLALSTDGPYQASLYSREIVPRTYAWFDRWPEFRALESCGYQRRPEAAL